MSRAKIHINKKRLYILYNDRNFTPKQIGRIYSCDAITVRSRMKEYGIALKSPAVARMRYPKWDFHGSYEVKAYMIAFRLGDLNVYTVSPASQTIVVRCHTTQIEQVRIMELLFVRYGKVTVSLNSGHYHVNCYLNRTFDFLIPKKDADWNWVNLNDRWACSFIAGYVDAEGNFVINQKRARFKVDSYDLEILTWMSVWLHSHGIINRFNRIYKEGDKWNGKYPLNMSLWRLNVNDALSLRKFISLIMPFVQHAKRLEDMNVCLANILSRTNYHGY